jgi:hypothetical protein
MVTITSHVSRDVRFPVSCPSDVTLCLRLTDGRDRRRLTKPVPMR